MAPVTCRTEMNRVHGFSLFCCSVIMAKLSSWKRPESVLDEISTQTLWQLCSMNKTLLFLYWHVFVYQLLSSSTNQFCPLFLLTLYCIFKKIQKKIWAPETLNDMVGWKTQNIKKHWNWMWCVFKNAKPEAQDSTDPSVPIHSSFVALSTWLWNI